MKILFLTHPFPNYGIDLLLHGFRKLFDADVIDYPRKESLYTGELMGFSPEGQVNHPWFPPDGNRIDRDDIPRKIVNGYFQYIICDSRIFPQFMQTTSNIPKGLVVVDGEDRPFQIPVGPYVICRRETDGSDYSIPLPMSLPEEVFQWISSYDSNSKDYSVGFLGSVLQTYKERQIIVEEISKCYDDCLFNVCPVPLPGDENPQGWLTRDEYYRHLQKCKVLLTVKGAGYDTFRFWENAACNAVHMTQKMPLFIPNDFEHGLNILKFTTLPELKKQIAQALENKTDCRRIIQESRAHLLRYHTTQARALYLLDRLRAIP